MAFTAAVREAAVTAAVTGTTVSLHTADPGTTGANEVSGGSPAYARKTTAWTAGATDGSITGSQVTFDVPAGTYSWVGVWNGTTFQCGIQLASSATFSGQGQLQVTPTVTA